MLGTKKVLRLGMLLAVAFASVRAEAAVIRVSAANTTGIENGSAESPFSTIQAGINAAAANDEVVVAPGIYFGAIELKSLVKLVGEGGPAVTIIDALGAGTAVSMPYDAGPSCSIEGFTVRNAGTGFYVTNRVNFWSGSTLAVSNAIVRDVGLGIEAFPMSSVSVTKSIFTRVDRVVDSIWCNPVSFTNVTVDGVGGVAFNMYQTATHLRNTTLSNAAAAFATWGHWGSGYVYGSNDNVYNVGALLVPGWNGQLPYLAYTSVLAVDPQFVNGAAGDYRLAAGSPLVDAGIDVGLPFLGAAPDIGAIEGGPTPLEAGQALAESYAAVPLPAFKNAGEQRRHALTNKLAALIKQLAARPDLSVADQIALYQDARNKLLNDIWAKADGFYGGNPTNDWITTQAEQDALYPKVVELRDLIDAEIARLGAQ